MGLGEVMNAASADRRENKGKTRLNTKETRRIEADPQGIQMNV